MDASLDDPALDSEEDESALRYVVGPIFAPAEEDGPALRYVVGPIGPALLRCRGGWDDIASARWEGEFTSAQ